MAKFSIIIPTYNSAESINIALKSIKIQTTSDYEVVIIDGNSSDHTIDETFKIFEGGSNIIRYSEPDQGIYDAMNKGLKLAQGEWIYFLGSDDRFYDENVLENVSRYLQEPYDVVYGDVVSTRFNGRYDGEFTPQKLFEKNICHQAIFFRKRLFDKTGNFNLKFKGHADWDHNMKWFLNSTIKRKYIDLVIAEYADGGISSIHGDPVFSAEKRTKFVNYSWKYHLSKSLRPVFLSEIKTGIKNGNLRNTLISVIGYTKSFL